MAYSAAGSAGLALKIQGLREAKAAFQALPELTRDGMLAATELTASEMVRAERAQILASPSVETRSLYNHIGYKVTPTNGRAKVGVTTGSATFTIGKRTFVRNPSATAHFVEFGTRNMAAEPFVMPAAEGQKAPYLDRCKAAMRQVAVNTAAIGLRFT